MHTDWQLHKKYCKRLRFVKFSEAKEWIQGLKRTNPQASELFKTALEAATATGNICDIAYVQMTPMAAENFVKVTVLACLDIAYQKALKFGDLSAQQLMDCLLSRPKASKALTKALQKVKVVQTEFDSLQDSYRVLDRIMEMCDGLVIESEFDRWPVKEGAAAAAAGQRTG
eukprot:gene1414-1756_t